MASQEFKGQAETMRDRKFSFTHYDGDNGIIELTACKFYPYASGHIGTVVGTVLVTKLRVSIHRVGFVSLSELAHGFKRTSKREGTVNGR